MTTNKITTPKFADDNGDKAKWRVINYAHDAQLQILTAIGKILGPDIQVNVLKGEIVIKEIAPANPLVQVPAPTESHSIPSGSSQIPELPEKTIDFEGKEKLSEVDAKEQEACKQRYQNKKANCEEIAVEYFTENEKRLVPLFYNALDKAASKFNIVTYVSTEKIKSLHVENCKTLGKELEPEVLKWLGEKLKKIDSLETLVSSLTELSKQLTELKNTPPPQPVIQTYTPRKPEEKSFLQKWTDDICSSIWKFAAYAIGIGGFGFGFVEWNQCDRLESQVQEYAVVKPFIMQDKRLGPFVHQLDSVIYFKGIDEVLDELDKQRRDAHKR